MVARWGHSFRSSDFNGSQQHGKRRTPDLPVPDPGGRQCAQGQWCAGAVTGRDGSKTGTPGPRAFCDRDRGRIESALAELPRLYTSLSSELGTPSQSSSPVRSPFGPRLPLRGDIDAIMALYAEILVSWHERVAAIANLTAPPEQVRRAVAVARAVAVIAPRLDALLSLEPEPMRRAVSLHALADLGDDTAGIVRSVYAAITPDLSGADAGLEILRLHRVSRAVLGETRERPVELLGVPCRVEDCDMLALRRAELPSDPDEDAPWSECAVCGDVMSEAEYREWVALCAAYERNRARGAQSA
jgi:hypothetical protein